MQLLCTQHMTKCSYQKLQQPTYMTTNGQQQTSTCFVQPMGSSKQALVLFRGQPIMHRYYSSQTTSIAITNALNRGHLGVIIPKKYTEFQDQDIVAQTSSANSPLLQHIVNSRHNFHGTKLNPVFVLQRTVLSCVPKIRPTLHMLK